MSRTDFLISCPYCRRQYQMKLDREEITRKKTRATCGRCGNTFELASRIAVVGAAAMAPTAAGAARRPPPTPSPAARPSVTPPPIPLPQRRAAPVDPRQAEDFADLTRDVAEAAEQISSQPKAAPLLEDPYAQYEQETIAAPPVVDEHATSERSEPPEVDVTATGKFAIPPEIKAEQHAATVASPAPIEEEMESISVSATDSAIAIDSATATDSGAASDTATDSVSVSELDSAPELKSVSATDADARMEPPPVAELAPSSPPKTSPPPPPKTWTERSDPGLAGLSRVPSATVAALVELLH